MPAQIVWQFVTTLGESEPVQGGYRVYVPSYLSGWSEEFLSSLTDFVDWG